MDSRSIVYQVAPSLFRDGDGHGWGTLGGVTEKLDHLAGLGVDALWLLPFYASGDRDGGYDVVDHCRIDPRLGDDRQFDLLVRRANALGMQVIVELVVQHTSDRHRWFRRARSSPHSRYRDYYIWQRQPRRDEPRTMFPPVESGTWRRDAAAGSYYRHRFYAHEPDLEIANPRVREEIHRIMAHWLDRGILGFRVDAVPYMVERAALADPRDDGLWFLEELRAVARRRRADAVLIGEADVEATRYCDYLADDRRLSHVLDFHLNNHFFLALAREDATVVAGALCDYRHGAPADRRMAWLRNNDELDLEQLDEDERRQVLDRFAPQPIMRIYRRGIRRRLAPMLDGDVDRQAMAHALLLSLGQPAVLRYGDEIGMGDLLELPERNCVRTPMQWSAGSDGGFSDGGLPWRAPISDGPYDYGKINVAAQAGDPASLLERIRAMLLARRALPSSAPQLLPSSSPALLAVALGEGNDRVLMFVNFSGDSHDVAIPPDQAAGGTLLEGNATRLPDGSLHLSRYGYAWLRSGAGTCTSSDS